MKKGIIMLVIGSLLIAFTIYDFVDYYWLTPQLVEYARMMGKQGIAIDYNLPLYHIQLQIGYITGTVGSILVWRGLVSAHNQKKKPIS